MKYLRSIIIIIVACMVSGGCVSHKEILQEQPKPYRVPQAHYDLHKKLMSEQDQIDVQLLRQIFDNGKSE